jgi:hypothetical protein
MRELVVAHGATVVEQIDSASFAFVLHVVASASDSACVQLLQTHAGAKVATVHYVREAVRRGVAIPDEWNGQLLLSFALKDAVVCCTGLQPEEKTRLHRIVFALGGTVARTLQSGVTHLVANKTDTVKYMELSAQVLLSAQRVQRSPYDSVVVCQPAWLDRCDREQPLTREAVSALTVTDPPTPPLR